jgi:hypothetical protein
MDAPKSSHSWLRRRSCDEELKSPGRHSDQADVGHTSSRDDGKRRSTVRVRQRASRRSCTAALSVDWSGDGGAAERPPIAGRATADALRDAEIAVPGWSLYGALGRKLAGPPCEPAAMSVVCPGTSQRNTNGHIRNDTRACPPNTRAYRSRETGVGPRGRAGAPPTESTQ